MTDELKAFVEQSRARWAREYKPAENARLLGFADTLLGKREPELADPRQMSGKPSRFWFPGLSAEPWHDRRHYPWLDSFESEFPAIRAELDAVTARLAEAKKIEETRPDFDHHGWREYRLWRYEDAAWLGTGGAGDDGTAANRAECPRTTAALARLPRFGNAAFSKVEPGGHIELHHSDFNAKVICQLALIVPEGVWIEVEGERRGWTEGKAFVFDDTFMHEVKNEGKSPRVVLLFDVWHYGLTPLERKEVAALAARAAELGHNPVKHTKPDRKGTGA